MLEVSRQDYVHNARAKGAPERLIIFRHAFCNALIQLATIAAFDFTSVGFVGIPGWWGKSYLDAATVVNGGRPTLSVIPEWIDGAGIVWGEHPFGQNSSGKDYFAFGMSDT